MRERVKSIDTLHPCACEVLGLPYPTVLHDARDLEEPIVQVRSLPGLRAAVTWTCKSRTETGYQNMAKYVVRKTVDPAGRGGEIVPM